MNLTELRRQAIQLGIAQAAITRCVPALGDHVTNEILARLNSALASVQDRIDIAEGTTT